MHPEQTPIVPESPTPNMFLNRRVLLIILGILIITGGAYCYTSYFPQTNEGQIQTAQELAIEQKLLAQGIVLPPDPGEAGKQTLQGIDSDKDGVRDDVQRWISLNTTTETVRLALRDAAAALQLALVATTSNEEELRAASTAQGAAAHCLVSVTRGLPNTEQVLIDLSDRVLNTSLRRDAYRNYGASIRSLKLGRQKSPPSSEFGGFCTFDPSVVGN